MTGTALSFPQNDGLRLALSAAEQIGYTLFGRIRALGLYRHTRDGDRLILPTMPPLVLSDGERAYYVIYPLDPINLPVKMGEIDRACSDLSQAIGLPVRVKRQAMLGGIAIPLSLAVSLIPVPNGNGLPSLAEFDLSSRPAGPLQMFLGQSGTGDPLWRALPDFVHMLITGTSGSGKSSLIRSILASLLLHATPDELIVRLIDGKQMEFNFWRDAPHVVGGVASSVREATFSIQEVVKEMDRRQALIASAGMLDFSDYNRTASRPLPRLLVAVDELAMFWLSGGRRSGFYVQLIDVATRARGSGIHLFVATGLPHSDTMDAGLKASLETVISGHHTEGASRAAFKSPVAANLPMLPGRMVAANLPGHRGFIQFQAPRIDGDLLRQIAARVSGKPIPDSQALAIRSCTSQAEQDVYQAVQELGYFTVSDVYDRLRGKVLHGEVQSIGYRWHSLGWLEKRREGKVQRSYPTDQMAAAF